MGVKNQETGVIRLKKDYVVEHTNSHPARKHRKILGLPREPLFTAQKQPDFNLTPFQKEGSSSWGTATEDPRSSLSFSSRCLLSIPEVFPNNKAWIFLTGDADSSSKKKPPCIREASASTTCCSILFWHPYNKGWVRRTSMAIVTYYNIILLFTILSWTAHQKTNCGKIIKMYCKTILGHPGKDLHLT